MQMPKQTGQQHSHDTPKGKGERRRWPRTAITTAMAGLALVASGCFAERGGATPAPTPQPRGSGDAQLTGPASPTDDLAQQLYGLRPLHEALGQDLSSADVPSQRDQIRTSDDPVARRVFGAGLIKFVRSETLLGQVRNLEEVRVVMNGAHPKDVATAEQVLAAKATQDYVEDVQQGTAEPEDNPVGAEIGETGVIIRPGVDRAARFADAADALSGVYDDDSAKEAIKDIKGLKDPSLSELARDRYEYEVVQDVCLYGATKAEAKAALAKVKNPRLRELIRAYTKAEAANDYTMMGQIDTELYDWEDKLDAREASLNDKAEAAEADLPSPSDIVDEAERTVRELLEKREKGFEKRVDQANQGLHPSKLEAFSPLEDPLTTLHLTDVTSDKKLYKYDTPDEFAEMETKEFAQIAEAYVQDGKLGLHFEDSTNLDDTTKADIASIWEQVKPLAEAAMASEQLLTIRLHVGQTGERFDGSADSMASTVDIQLPADDTVSKDMLRRVLIHELTHVLTHKAYAGDRITPQQLDDMKTACVLLADKARQAFADSLNQTMEPLDELSHIAELTPAQRAVFATVKKYVREGTINKGMNDDTEPLPYMTIGCEIPELKEILDRALGEVSDKYPNEKDLTMADIDQALEDADKKDAYHDLITQWIDATEYSSLYDEFNEAASVKGPSEETVGMGHSKDNASELSASVMSALLGDTKYMTKLYASAVGEDKAAIKLTVVAVSNLMKPYPTLWPTVREARDQMLGRKK